MLEYVMSVTERSAMLLFTPDVSARAFPFWVSEAGRFDADIEYFTRRDDKCEPLLMLTREGCGLLTRRGKTCRLEPGTAVLIRCDEYHEYRTAPEGRWVFDWIHMGGAGLPAYDSTLFDRLAPVVLHDRAAAYELFMSLWAHAEQSDILAAAERSNILSALLTEMVRSIAHGDQRDPLRRDDITELAEFIKDNCEKTLTLEELSRRAGLTKYHMIRLFSRQLGMPPYRFLHSCRINRAKLLLRSTSDPVSSIAAAVGYADTVVFARHFRARAGVSPLAYRRDSTTV